MSDRVIVPKDRIFERAQGCWNCKHCEHAGAFWLERRTRDLTKALSISAGSTLGEKDQRVLNIRRMVDVVDGAIAAGKLIRCGGQRGRTANGEQVGDLIASNYLCDQWSGASGASIARAGGALDKLPEELAERLDGVDSVSNVTDELIAKGIKDKDGN